MNENFLKRVSDRMHTRGVKGRQDLELHDARSLESGRAVRVLATYSPLFGPPSTYDVQEWVKGRMGEFGAQVIARPDTVAAYPENNTVTFIVEQRASRQPLSASAEMTPAGVNQFLDASNVLWETQKSEKGAAFLVRREGVTIERMLEIRRQALRAGMSGRKNVMLANLDTMPVAGGGFATAEIGDVVDFYQGGMIQRGKVQSAGKSGVKVKALNGSEVFTIDPQAITAVIEKSPAAEKEQDDVTRTYFSLIYPGNPEMTEIISPLSSKPIRDPRPLKVEPIEMAASASKEATARPTTRAFGKMLTARVVRKR